MINYVRDIVVPFENYLIFLSDSLMVKHDNEAYLKGGFRELRGVKHHSARQTEQNKCWLTHPPYKTVILKSAWLRSLKHSRQVLYHQTLK